MLTNIAGVQFQRTGKIYDFFYKNMAIKVGDQVWVDDDSGGAVARVAILKYEPTPADTPLKSVLRLAETYGPDSSRSDLSADNIFQCAHKGAEHYKLKMKILSCEHLPASEKVMIYFSADERVDFRELVKDLAGRLRSRVELRQVRARDETKLLGGVGICGRAYCCSTFLREFVPVSIKMAKNQNLALGPSQTMGGCGRLLCCLTYEDDLYTHLRSTLPTVGSKIGVFNPGELPAPEDSPRVPDHVGHVISLDLLNQGVWWRKDGERKREYASLGDFSVLELAGSSRKKGRSRHSSDGGSSSRTKRGTSSSQRGDRGTRDRNRGQRGASKKRETRENWGEDLDIEALVAFQDQSS